MVPDVKVCEKCSDNFIVSTKVVKCFLCLKMYHPICISVKDGAYKLLNENLGFCWVCEACEEQQSKKCTINNVSSQNNQEKEVLAAENVLLREMVKETQSKNEILLENANLLKEKILTLNQKIIEVRANATIPNATAQNSHGSNSSLSNRPKPQTSERDQNKSSYSNRASQGLQINSRNDPSAPSCSAPNLNSNIDNINKNNRNTITIGQTNSKIGPEQVKTAIHRAQIANKIQELQNINDDIGRNDGGGWQTQGRRRRRFVVGRNESTTSISTVPKLAYLHVSRLAPTTKPDDLKKMLSVTFPDVLCEAHPSKHPDIYTSVKVTIQQKDLKNAWRRDIWPLGAIVSPFFQKRRTTSAIVASQVGPHS